MTLARRYEPNWPGIKVKLPGPIAQENLWDAYTEAGIDLYPDQFGDLVRAVYASGVSLQRLDGSGISWRCFEDYSDSLARILQGVNNFSLEFVRVDDASKEESQLADGAPQKRGDLLGEALNGAPGLQTLEISFHGRGTLSIQSFQCLPLRMHWPSLKRLKLEAIVTSQLALMNLLSRHARTLKSLELGHILLDWREARDGTCAGSWTSMIRFPHQELSLTDVSLHGDLSNGFDEFWEGSTERWHPDSLAQLPPLEETLKFKIERYIVEGGVCPLDNPDDGDEDAREEFGYAIEDYSWRWRTGLYN